MKRLNFFILLVSSAACGRDNIKVSDAAMHSPVMDVISVYRQIAGQNGFDGVYDNVDLNVKIVPAIFPCKLSAYGCYGLTETWIPGNVLESKHHTMTLATVDVLNSKGANFAELENPEELWKSGLVHELTHVFFPEDPDHKRDDLWCDVRGHNRGAETCDDASLFQKVMDQLIEINNQ